LLGLGRYHFRRAKATPTGDITHQNLWLTFTTVVVTQMNALVTKNQIKLALHCILIRRTINEWHAHNVNNQIGRDF